MAVNEDIEITIESEPSQFTELEVIPIYGPTGNGISRIEKTDTSYNVDTYTIYFTNGTTTIFTVTNGVSILDIQKTDTTGLVDTYTISLSDGNTHTFTVTNGVGISNIAKTSTSGLVDTYTVTLNNSDSYTFTVTNGKAGTIEIGTVTTGTPETPASVTNVGTDNEAILDFVIPKGDKGDTGDTGTAATISVGTTTTGEAGTQASVTNSGSTSAAVFNFTIPKGAKGDTGNTGATGNGVTGITLLSWVGLIKTYRMTFSDGSYFDYTVENGTGQVDWGGISGVISQQTDLQDVLHSSKGYLDNGTLLTDTTLYNDVYGYNHSTFDLSKFTVIGTPTITDEGIVSNIESSNYVRINYTVPVSTANSWSMQVRNFAVNSLASLQRFFAFNSNNTFIYIDTEGKIKVYVSASSTGDIANNQYANYTVSLNEIISAELRFTGSTYEVWINGNKTWTVSSTTKISANQVATVYCGGSGYAPCLGEHDLKQFSITVDGKPVFSGTKTGIDTYTINNTTVTIPYTLSKTGSKIVDVAYRDRVQDVFEQYGSALYYTIDETNKNVTLPMGELYGLIGQRTLRASYRNGINYWEEYSDRTLEQGGSCTSGTTVNLLKPFADTNYVLTIPYSAKTTTSFTPSASGDWIAKGLGE